MRREELIDLSAFAAVAEERSFTRAAAKLGTSQSALSHTINRLESRVGVRLLTRTTRKVSPTEAGEKMLQALAPALDAIAYAVASARELREKPAGTIRITTSEHAAHAVLSPALEKLLPNYPDVRVELVIESGFTDIVGGAVRRGRAARRIDRQGHGRRAHRARTCVWRSWGRRITSPPTPSRAPRKTSPSTSAST